MAPDLEAALYVTYVVLILVGGSGWTLMGLVFSQRAPQTASDPAALPASGGSGAWADAGLLRLSIVAPIVLVLSRIFGDPEAWGALCLVVPIRAAIVMITTLVVITFAMARSVSARE